MEKLFYSADKTGSLCADDYKGPNNQYVSQGKVVAYESLRRVPVRSVAEVFKSRTTAGFRRIIWGGTESIVTDEKACDIRNSKEDDINGALQSMASNNLQSNNVVRQHYAVRRLTPTECERLQGLPDDYTLIDDKTCSDSARYKALGNGMAQPCADFVIRRIVQAVESDSKGVLENENRPDF